MTDPTTPAEWAAHYQAEGVPADLAVLLVSSLEPDWPGDVVTTDEDTIDRSTARELLTRVALGHDSLTAALAQLRRPAP